MLPRIPLKMLSLNVVSFKNVPHISRTLREFKIRLYGVKSITQSFLKLPPHLYKCGGKVGNMRLTVAEFYVAQEHSSFQQMRSGRREVKGDML